MKLKTFTFVSGVMLIIAGLSFLATDTLLENKYKNTVVIIEEENMITDVPLNIPCQECVYIQQGLEVNSQGNPIYDVSVITGGNTTVFKTVSGRAWTQDLDRNIPGNSSPSPSGEYVIKQETKGVDPETGGVFLPYEPLFKTERSFLGFHQDPSWGKSNGEDGTEGCHAFKTMSDYYNFVKLVNDNNITKLIIK